MGLNNGIEEELRNRMGLNNSIGEELRTRMGLNNGLDQELRSRMGLNNGMAEELRNRIAGTNSIVICFSIKIYDSSFRHFSKFSFTLLLKTEKFQNIKI
jgi:hypothetical protein